MRLMRLGAPGAERPHLLGASGMVLDVGDDVGDFDPQFFARGGVADLAALLRGRTERAVPVGPVRVGAPIARPGKIVCIGLNYRDHATESGMALPAEPVIFMKASNTLVGPNDDVLIPRGSSKTDWEVELGVVIGSRVHYAESEAVAEAAIAGYMVCNDVSEREFQLERGSQWDKGKSCETFNPAGPWLATPDEVGDAADLAMFLEVNGLRRQDSTTAHMHVKVPELIRYISQFMVLEPGDIINTGTPAGVALGMPDTPYLRPGDRVRLGIEGLGEQEQVMVPSP